MPTLIRYDAIRLIEASLEALCLAVNSLGAKKRVHFRQSSAEFSIEVGLIGASAELIMSACIVQAFGSRAILFPTGRYKTASVIFTEFRALASQSTTNSLFLTDGVADPAAHRRLLLEKVNAFTRLIPIRAAGLHAGRGLIHEAVVSLANTVSEFMELLALSRRLHPYLDGVPRCLWYSRDRTIILEDLVARMHEAQGAEKSTLLSSIFLVLPDVPEEEPEWLDALARISAVPQEHDVEYMMTVLDNALPATLRRAGKGTSTIPVRVEPDNPASLPIAPQYLRRQFNQIPDLWHADIASANGRLDQKALDLPPLSAVLEVFALGFDRAGILSDNELLTAHQAWPHIATSLSFHGTAGPYWFLVRKCNDLAQLSAILARSAGSLRRFNERLNEFREGVTAIRESGLIAHGSEHLGSIVSEIGGIDSNRSWLRDRESRYRGTVRAMPSDLVPLLEDVAEGGEPIGSLLCSLLECERDQQCLTYWPRVLSELASDLDDVPGLVLALNTEGASAGHSAARRALRRIDFSVYGPSVEETAE